MSSIEYINSVVLTASAANVTFSNIPQHYQDLIITGSIKATTANVGFRYRFNNDSGSNYSSTYIYGNGTSALSSRESNQTSAYANITIGSNYTPINMNILNYSDTSIFKTSISEDAASDYTAGAIVSLWRSTSAITSITYALGSSFPSQNISSGLFTLWGVK